MPSLYTLRFTALLLFCASLGAFVACRKRTIASNAVKPSDLEIEYFNVNTTGGAPMLISKGKIFHEQGEIFLDFFVDDLAMLNLKTLNVQQAPKNREARISPDDHGKITDLSQPKKYTVQLGKETKTYTVTAQAFLNSNLEIETFTASYDTHVAQGAISHKEETIDVVFQLDEGQYVDVRALKTAVTLKDPGASFTPTAQVVDFSAPVTYTVRKGRQTKDYKVIVEVVPPCIITEETHLQRANNARPGTVCELKNDLVLTQPLQPIENFKGIFKGNSFTISNIVFQNGEKVGLFDELNGAQDRPVQVQDLTLVPAANQPNPLTVGHSFGVLAGTANQVLIDNVHVKQNNILNLSSNASTSRIHIGLLAGISQNLQLTNSTVNGTGGLQVRGGEYSVIGGLIGWLSGAATIDNVKVDIAQLKSTGTDAVFQAGIIANSGHQANVTLTRVSASIGEMTVDAEKYAVIGGLVATSARSWSTTLTIEGSFAQGKISVLQNRGDSYIGGLLGDGKGNMSIKDTRTEVQIQVNTIADDKLRIGGFAGSLSFEQGSVNSVVFRNVSSSGYTAPQAVGTRPCQPLGTFIGNMHIQSKSTTNEFIPFVFQQMFVQNNQTTLVGCLVNRGLLGYPEYADPLFENGNFEAQIGQL